LFIVTGAQASCASASRITGSSPEEAREILPGKAIQQGSFPESGAPGLIDAVADKSSSRVLCTSVETAGWTPVMAAARALLRTGRAPALRGVGDDTLDINFIS